MLQVETENSGMTWLTTEEACEMLRISRTTLFNVRKRHAGPRCTRLGRRLFWNKETLLEWLRNQEDSSDVEAVTDVATKPSRRTRSKPVAAPVAAPVELGPQPGPDGPRRRRPAPDGQPLTLAAMRRQDLATRAALDDYARQNQEQS
jgi:predicted DNA-binding transcriptional regulator AlpA